MFIISSCIYINDNLKLFKTINFIFCNFQIRINLPPRKAYRLESLIAYLRSS